MTTMAGMAFGETPERVLKRVQQLEDVELPSLPSFSHEVDFESEFDESDQGEQSQMMTKGGESEMDMATPHPRRQMQSYIPTSSPDQSNTTDNSPYPPLDASIANSEEPDLPKSTATSTPLSRHRSRSLGRSGKTDRTREMGNSTKVSSSRWQTPGEMSYSFSAEAISQDGLEDLGSERSVPLNDASSRMNRSSVGTSSTTTPVTKRLTTSHVTLERPKRRVTSNPSQLQALQDVAQELQKSPSISNHSAKSPEKTLHPQTTDRVPSLTRSEVSAPETSVGATTPEGPSRRVNVITPRSEGRSRTADQVGDDSADTESAEHDWMQQEGGESINEDRSLQPTDQEERSEPDQTREVTGSFQSPAKIGASVSYGQFSTPGVARDAPSGTASPRSFSRSDDPPSISAIHDMTAGHSQAASFPFTPTPVGFNSKYENLSTPRAPLNDAERRKSHVLAVLSSSGIPARTPRPMARGTPHPLRRVSIAPTSESITEEGSSSSQRASSATPGGRTLLLSAHDAGMQSYNDSFVSIASSADLTSDKRASHYTSRISRGNTSFPNILLPGAVSQNSPGGSLRGVSDQRANGAKIHKHLNAMNKQLLDSNADLAREAEAWRDEVERLKGLLQGADVDFEDVDVLANLPERSQGDLSTTDLLRQTRYTTPADSSQDGTHNPLERSHSAPIDGDHNNTAILHEMAEKLEGLEGALAEKDDIIAELEQRLDTGGSDVSIYQQVGELREQLDEAEQLRERLHADFSQKTEQHAQRFGEICTGFEEQVKGLEAELASSRTEVDRLRADKTRMEELASAASTDDREREWRKQVSGLEYDLGRAKEEVRIKTDQVDALHKRLSEADSRRTEMEEEVQTARDRLTALESDRDQRAAHDSEAETARQEMARLETELAAAHTEIEEIRQVAEARQSDLEGNQEQLVELAAQLGELEQRAAQHDDEEVRRLHDVIEETNAALTEKEAELESLRARLDTEGLRRSIIGSATEQDKPDMPAANDSFVAAMEERLDEAHHEIGRLKHQLAASPHRASSIEVRDARIKALEREKAALTDRLAAKESSIIAATSVQGAISPFKASPFVHKAIASLKTPKTPGPLKEYSWLQSSVGDANEPVLRAQMEYLQDELKNANDQLDNNFSRLESAGFGALALAEKLAKANERISDLEDEIRALGQRNKVSLALVTAQRDEENRDHDDHLQKVLDEMNEQMTDLKADLAAERSRLQRDNQRLQDLLSEINLKRQAEIDSFRSEMARMEEEAEANLEDVKRETLALSQQVDRLKEEKQSTTGQIRQLEHDLAVQLDAYDDLQARLTQSDAKEELEAELQAQHARLDTLETSLRDSNLATDRLRLSLREKSDALRHAESKVESLQRERKVISKELLAFEADLKNQRFESEEFGRELAKIRDDQAVSAKYELELDQMRRDYRTARESLRHAKDQLAKVVDRVSELEEWQVTHCHDERVTDQALAEQHAHFKAQTRDLAVQIRYLKAKFTRESTFRSALAAQKRYFLVMIGGMSLNEEATLRELAAMGCPVPPVQRPRRTLKHVGLAVLSLIRARKLAGQWRSEVELKSGAVRAHQERRKASGKV